MNIHLSRPDITEKEIESVCQVLRSCDLSLGPKLPQFEQAFTNYIGTRRAVAVHSGTSGLFLCLLSLGIGQDDEVITTPFTFIASTTTIMATGARPVFVDIDPATLNIGPLKIESAITEKTKAILPVEIFGNPAGFDKICAIAEKYNLPVIEDSCEALGSSLNGKKAGTFGKMSVFGFYPNKQITTGEGGMILTDDDELADLCVSLRNQGRGKSAKWLYHERLGYNFRLSDINCALGIAQLARIEEMKAKRQQVARWYQEMLADDERLTVPSQPPGCDINWFVFVVRLAERFTSQERNLILQRLFERGIQTNNYFPPIHLQPFIAKQLGHKKGDFPITEAVAERTIALPYYNNLKKDEIAIVCNILKQILEQIKSLSE